METNAPQGFFGRLGGLLGPQGLTPEEQTQLGRQGLLQMGLGILANNHDRYNAGAAVGSGLLAGISAMQKSGKDLIDRRTGRSDPAWYRTVDMLARGAGYEPGSDEYKQFMRVAGGIEGRASNAGVSFDTFTDAAGDQRPQRNNPRTGGVELWVDEQGRWVPLGEGLGAASGSISPPATPRNTAGGTTFTTSTGEPFDVSQVSDPVLRAQIIANPEAWGMAPDGAQAQLPPQEVATFTPAPIPGLGRGRRKEDEAAAIERAKTNVQLGALPTELGMRTDAAVQQATEIERGKAGVELDTKQTTRARDAGTALDLISEARRLLPNATGGTLGAAADATAGFFGHATQGAQANAALKTIAGQMTSKMPRMEGPQSDRDVQMYKDMAGDVGNANLPVKIRLAALAQIERLNKKYANNPSGRSGPAAGVVEDGYRFKGGDPADPNNWERL